jgi:hypothetical protein
MQDLRSLQFITDRKYWLSNVLLGGVCMLVPVVGPIVFTGYLFEVIDALLRDPGHRDYPDFDFNRLGDYLSRGVWPFLMQLVLALIIGVPLGLIAAVLLGVGIGITARANSPVVMVVFQLLTFAVSLAAGILSALVTLPAELQAGLGREFDLSRVLAFVKDFNKRVFKEMLTAVLFVVAIAVVAAVVGLLLFCVGIYFTLAAVVMAQHHLQFQLYRLYLERGGAPIAGGEARRAGRNRRRTRRTPPTRTSASAAGVEPIGCAAIEHRQGAASPAVSSAASNETHKNIVTFYWPGDVLGGAGTMHRQRPGRNRSDQGPGQLAPVPLP